MANRFHAGSSDRDRFLRQTQSTIDYVVRLCNSDTHSRDIVESIQARLASLKHDIERSVGVLISREEKDELTSIVEDLVNEIEKNARPESDKDSGFQAKREPKGQVGAPKFEITREQLDFLIKFGFTAPMIAESLHTSESTIRRRLREFDMKLREGRHTAISNEELDTRVKEIIGTNKRIGPNTIRVRLAMDNINVTRETVRNSCHRVDPAGCALRSIERQNINRRTYKVAGPNSLWHLDGNHKLIRWGFVIHGAVDGYSRLITFVHASLNNRSLTVFDLFIQATKQFGIPSRIRVDHGTENNDVCVFMEGYRGAERGSAIRGKSSHNQRIERLWVDLWDSVTNEYYDLFNFLENSGLLDVSANKHLWALHYVFLPRINKSLEMFTYQHNHHGLSTENSKTPYQIFIAGVLQNINSEDKSIHDLMLLAGNHDEITQSPLEQYGIEEEDGLSLEEEVEPTTEMCQQPISDEDYQTLCNTVDPIQDYKSMCHGVEIYKNVISFIDSVQDSR